MWNFLLNQTEDIKEPIPYRRKIKSITNLVMGSHSEYVSLFSWTYFASRIALIQKWCCILVGKYTPQYRWLEDELPKVNRSETPWLIVLMHSPWYNSYNYHYMEGETMRVMYETWFVKYKVDVVFAGHVHAYERSVSSPQLDFQVCSKSIDFSK